MSVSLVQIRSFHRVIMLLEREHAFTIELEESDANFPDQHVQRHSVTSLETACSLANSHNFAEGEVCILRSPEIAAPTTSLLSMGGVCGRSLTAGKILFTGRQTCSLYLVL